MNPNKVTIKVTTRSNLFIGGSPSTFEIGGVDLFTVTNEKGLPYIPASSFKGTLRHIIKESVKYPGEQQDHGRVVTRAYEGYLKTIWENSQEELKQYNIKGERIQRMNDRYAKVIKESSAQYLFGIEGFNDTPKLIFNDLQLVEEQKEIQDWFSIDSKNSIEQSQEGGVPKVHANPRTYKVVRPGISFIGDILLYNIDQLNMDDAIMEPIVQRFVRAAISQFNSGLYRLGNSGSRGYGRVTVEFVGEDA
ncbi:RAMP superfamily CRISPR-associated protein [Paenibacillus sp. JJ-223]|uniref:RAMP superfamily CRISPR-associated protein n=1 Tax=Paenibacillus sp. JJ-223 TaxID=2905647 RepID=UPI001F3D917E|nr:RAMP superfamily CRISPR-associated protein [Paenibacillus sp. JJ-223]CAH1219096.1 hypothetical protein PAECIP111890_04850 [Paenibacillus sp. JJ-223]